MKEVAVDSILNRIVVRGVKDDFSMLLHRFVETHSVRYEMFAEVWRNAKMPLIFAGRQNEKEVREFTEECMTIASEYIDSSRGFQVQVGGLYLLYGIYFKQLCSPRVKIRMTVQMWQNLMQFLVDIRAQNHFDIEYIYWKLRYDNAFHFVAHTEEQTGLGRDHAVQNERRTEVDTTQIPTQISQLVEGDAIDQLSGIHEQYHRMKCALAGPTAQTPQASLNMIHPSLVQAITKKVASFDWWKKHKAGKRVSRRRHDSGPTTSESEADSETEKSPSSPRKRSRNMGKIRAEIKARAMGSTSVTQRSRRHRQVRAANDASPSSSGSPQKPAGRVSQPTETSDDEWAPSAPSSSQLESQASNGKEGVFSMPLFRHLEVSKTKQKKVRRKQRKAQVVSSGQEAKAKLGGRRKKKAATASADLLSSSMEECTTPKQKRKPRVKKNAAVDQAVDRLTVNKTVKAERKDKEDEYDTAESEEVVKETALSTPGDPRPAPTSDVQSPENAASVSVSNEAEVETALSTPGDPRPAPTSDVQSPENAASVSVSNEAEVETALSTPGDPRPAPTSDVQSPENAASVSVSDEAEVKTATSTRGRRGRKKKSCEGDLVADQTMGVDLKHETAPSSVPEVSPETVTMTTPTPVKRGRGRPPKARRGRPFKKS